MFLILARFVLENNYLSFGDTIWHQIYGTAMGTPFAVPYATIFLAVQEHSVFTICKIKKPSFVLPILYKRFIDDIMSIFYSQTDGELFLEVFNTYNTAIKLTSLISYDTAIFLDLEIYKGIRFFNTNKLDCRIYQKPSNKYLYIPPNSFHRPSVFSSFIISEVTRYRFLCTNDHEFTKTIACFRERLLNRGYTLSYLDVLFKSIPPLNRDILINNHRNKLSLKSQTNISLIKTTPPIFKTVFAPRTLLLNLSKCIRPPESLYLQTPQETMQVFTSRNPIVCYQRGPTLREALTSSTYPFSITTLSTSLSQNSVSTPLTSSTYPFSITTLSTSLSQNSVSTPDV
jgi:hypothetical protein